MDINRVVQDRVVQVVNRIFEDARHSFTSLPALVNSVRQVGSFCDWFDADVRRQRFHSAITPEVSLIVSGAARP